MRCARSPAGSVTARYTAAVVVAVLSPQFAWARRPSAKRAAVVAVVGIAALAALAGALAANHGTLARVEAATLSIRGIDAQGVQTTGTGMTLTPAGIVLTADRIVENADTISVRIPGSVDRETAPSRCSGGRSPMFGLLLRFCRSLVRIVTASGR